MRDKVVVISGGTSGIGRVAAAKLAAMGARIVFIARDRARGGDTLDELRAIRRRPGIPFTMPICPASLTYGEFGRRLPPRNQNRRSDQQCRRDLRPPRRHGRRPRAHIRAQSHVLFSADSGVARSPLGRRLTDHQHRSNAHRRGHIDFDDLQSARNFGASRVYGTSKLCNILFTRELARRLSGSGVTANSFSPGFRRHAVRRSIGRPIRGRYPDREAVRRNAGAGCANAALSRHIARRRAGQRRILFQVQARLPHA